MQMLARMVPHQTDVQSRASVQPPGSTNVRQMTVVIFFEH